MKTLRIALFLTMVVAGNLAQAQNPRDVLKSKLKFYYVADVTGTSAVMLNNNDISAGTFSGAFWSNSKMSGPQRLVKALLSNSSSGGDAKLQRLASEIIKIRNEVVHVYLLDDATTSITESTSKNFGACDNGAGKSWPCARSYDDTKSEAGQMCLGTNFLTTYMPGSRSASNVKEYRYATFVHELTHTQDNVDWRAHLHFDDQLGWFSYGSDGDHFGVEVLPDLNATYSEAIANAFAMYYDTYDYEEGFRWFAEGGEMYVEHAPSGYSGPAITSVLSAFQAAGVTPLGQFTHSGSRYSVFRMSDVPLGLIMNNEIMLAVMLESTRLYGGTDEYMAALTSSNKELFRVCANPVAVLFRNMCRVGLPPGVDDITSLNQSTGNYAYLFPLALADFFTAYEAQSKAEFKAIFENQGYMDPWIDDYWDNHRVTVMEMAPLSCGIGDLIDLVRQALGMS